MSFFEQDFIDFFTELKKNNSKDWFDANRKRYEKKVKKPFADFITAMIQGIQAHDSELLVEAKDCILRINRDIRFSKDKTPYNTHLTAFISKGGRKDKTDLGFFLRLSPEEVGIMVGCFHPDKDQLRQIRGAIASDMKSFSALINDRSFKSNFGELKGEEHKRIPPEFQEAVKAEPLIARKQFYAVATLSSEILLKDDLADQLMTYWHAARPYNLFLKNSFQK